MIFTKILDNSNFDVSLSIIKKLTLDRFILQKKNEYEKNNENEFSNNEITQKKESDFVFDENLFLNTITNDIIDKPNELYNSEIKVVNLNSEENI